MTEEVTLAAKVFIERFETRARWRKFESYSILALMLALVAVAAVIFVQAKEITNIDTGVRPQAAEERLMTNTKSR